MHIGGRERIEHAHFIDECKAKSKHRQFFAEPGDVHETRAERWICGHTRQRTRFVHAAHTTWRDCIVLPGDGTAGTPAALPLPCIALQRMLSSLHVSHEARNQKGPIATSTCTSAADQGAVQWLKTQAARTHTHTHPYRRMVFFLVTVNFRPRAFRTGPGLDDLCEFSSQSCILSSASLGLACRATCGGGRGGGGGMQKHSVGLSLCVCV